MQDIISAFLESGLDRYNLCLEGQDFNVIIDFKRAKKEADDLEELAGGAIEQINKKKYFATLPKTVPLYKVRVGYSRTECFVKTELH